jgi:hypothetical protein
VSREKKEEKMEQMRKAQEGPEGVPIFNIYVRSPNGARQWFPCGSFAGDQNAIQLVKASMGGFMSGMYKDTLDK